MSIDWILLQKYYQGDRASLEELIERHIAGLMRLFPRFDSQPEKATTFLNRYLCQLPLKNRKERVKANSEFEVKKSLQVLTKNVQDRFWINDYCRGKDNGIPLLFERYNKRLYLAALQVVKREQVARDIVATFQVYLLEMSLTDRRQKFGHGNVQCIQPYLTKAIVNRSLDWVKKHRKTELPGQQAIPYKWIYQEEEIGPSDMAQKQMHLVKQAVQIMPEHYQLVFKYWLKGIPNETIEYELPLKQTVHHLKEAIRRHVMKYIKAKENIYKYLLRSAKFSDSKDPSAALNSYARQRLGASELKYFLQFRNEHLTKTTTPIPNIEHMKQVVTIKRRIKKLLINGN